MRAAYRILVDAWGRERALVWMGVVGLALGLVGLIVLAAHGRFIPPEGDVTKPIAFNVALAVYALTLALVVPLARFAPAPLRCWRAAQVVLAVGSYAVANIQTYRGINPRLSRSPLAVDVLASVLFGLLALLGSVTFVMLAWRLFRRRADPDPGLVLLGARYGCAAALLGHASGLWMILARGARVGEAGDVLPLHALGFHGLQAVPVVAVLLAWGHIPVGAARRWVHVAGGAWIGACAGLLWQTLLGRSPLEPSPASAVSLIFLSAWCLAAARAVLAWRQAAVLSETAHCAPAATAR